jgi:hypothetical protein
MCAGKVPRHTSSGRMVWGGGRVVSARGIFCFFFYAGKEMSAGEMSCNRTGPRTRVVQGTRRLGGNYPPEDPQHDPIILRTKEVLCFRSSIIMYRNIYRYTISIHK